MSSWTESLRTRCILIVNKVKIEMNSDGSYVLTLPAGGQRHNLQPADVVKSLQDEEAKFQAAIADMKALRVRFEKMVS